MNVITVSKTVGLSLLFGLAVPVLADDANVLPAGVLRTVVAPSVTMIDTSFDRSGDRQDVDPIAVTTLSLGLEYGINDWVTAGLQWAPGYNLSGEQEGNNFDFSGANDVFLGAKMQLMGDRGLAANNAVRWAVTPGIKIPASNYNASEAFSSAMSGDEYKPRRTDRGAWALGARFAFDYLVTPDFYINLYNQTSFFLETNQDYGVSQTGPITDVDVQYGTEAIFEIEPNYGLAFNNGLQTRIGLPVTYTMTGETKIDGAGQNDERWVAAASPSVSVFFTQWVLPMEFELSYSAALAGESTNASNTLSLQIKNFLQL